MTKTIFLAIAFGTTVRDVLRNDTYRLLKERPDVHIVLFAQEVSDSFKQEFGGDNITFETLDCYTPTFFERVLIHFHRALLRDRSNTIDLGNTAGNTRTLDRITPFAWLCLKMFGFSAMNNILHCLYNIFAPANRYKEEFNRYKPDLVIVTRVLNYSADYPIMRRAATMKIPVVALVSSWDNLTSKGFFPFALKSLVVWNNVLKQEAIELFDFPEERIKVTGIPRYDLFYRRTGFSSRKTFFAKKGLDPEKRLITYGTGSQTTGRSEMDPVSPEPNIAAFIADKIQDGSIANAQLIVRLHPQADPAQYELLKDRNNVLLHIPGERSSFQDRLFSEADDVEYGETLLYSDLVINFGSTVTIDAAVFDTPIICVNFDFNGERPYAISPRRLYDFDHYAKLGEMGGFKLSCSRKEFVNDINKFLGDPTFLEAGRKCIVNQQCVFTDGRSGERIAKHLLETLDDVIK